MQFKLNCNFTPAAVLAMALLPSVNAGLTMNGICQTGCDTVAVACYAAASITTLFTPGAIVACNRAFATCSATCSNDDGCRPTSFGFIC